MQWLKAQESFISQNEFLRPSIVSHFTHTPHPPPPPQHSASQRQPQRLKNEMTTHESLFFTFFFKVVHQTLRHSIIRTHSLQLPPSFMHISCNQIMLYRGYSIKGNRRHGRKDFPGDEDTCYPGVIKYHPDFHPQSVRLPHLCGEFPCVT